ncbi:MAG: type II secretion system protein [Methylophilus sp.]|jgi:general secretion pathway protein G
MQKNQIKNGFTLIEILVVLAIIATLLSLVTPRYFDSMNRSKEKILKNDLIVIREAIDKYYSDKNVYPDSLEDLVQYKYLRQMPVDPITDSALTWQFSPPQDIEVQGAIYDIHSGSQDVAYDGSHYADW